MKVAIYARVSTKDKGQNTEDQLPELRRFAQVHGWTIYKEYIDEGSATTWQRGQFQQFFADAYQRRFDSVLFCSLDHFSREGALPTLMHLNEFDASGVGYKSFTEQYLDSTGLFKDAIISVLATIACQEGVRISERTNTEMELAHSNGLQIGAPAKSTGQIEQARRLKNEGKSNYFISEAIGISQSTV
jgi:DNA invertase Pin-like site-specific DNA recombinase